MSIILGSSDQADHESGIRQSAIVQRTEIDDRLYPGTLTGFTPELIDMSRVPEQAHGCSFAIYFISFTKMRKARIRHAIASVAEKIQAPAAYGYQGNRQVTSK
jgi:hypothetical protein